ncbi:iron ABC transporter permease [Candidatus Levibacter sp. Uisw_134_01]|uniref:ABC transporter permease n=1 Tax=Candidatus Levibacter sp. Uisw_134_01 TaxID=3230999 RepID=UPI003D52B048
MVLFSKISTFVSSSYLKLLCIAIIFLLLSPIISIIFSSFENTFSLWEHLFKTRLKFYLYNTFILMLGVGFTTFFIGVSLAWLICKYDFFMRNVIEWALLLPLALPSYIVAYCYTDFFEYSGFLQTSIRELFNFDSPNDYFFPEIRSLGGAIFVISFVLYPYIYLITKVAFKSTPSSLFELAELNGKNQFYYVALPLAKPAIIAGLSLVLMETVSDFGTVDFFAVETITLGIFNLWLGMNNLAGASQLALIGFFFIMILLAFELSARKKQKFNDTKIRGYNGLNQKISIHHNIFIFFICIIPIIFGFIIPVLILFENSISYFDIQNLHNLILITKNSFFISFVATVIIILTTILLTIGLKFHGFKGLSFLSTIAGIGYAFPGVILALGALFFVSSLETSINALLLFLNINQNLVLIGSFYILIFTYVCRFNAVAFGAINSGINRLPPNMVEASLTLGNSFWYSLKKVLFPLIKPSILTAAILTFVDIVKELPITLLLRPLNFETLATYVYQFASDEMLGRASAAALIIVLIGLIPILFINNLMSKKTI